MWPPCRRQVSLTRSGHVYNVLCSGAEAAPSLLPDTRWASLVPVLPSPRGQGPCLTACHAQRTDNAVAGESKQTPWLVRTPSCAQSASPGEEHACVMLRRSWPAHRSPAAVGVLREGDETVVFQLVLSYIGARWVAAQPGCCLASNTCAAIPAQPGEETEPRSHGGRSPCPGQKQGPPPPAFTAGKHQGFHPWLPGRAAPGMQAPRPRPLNPKVSGPQLPLTKAVRASGS